MPRTVTVTLSSGAPLQYNNVPDDVTPEMIEERARTHAPNAQILSIDGGVVPAREEGVLDEVADVVTSLAGAPEAEAPAQDVKGFARDLGSYYAGLTGPDTLDPSKIAQMAQQYNLPPIENLSAIEEHYKKYGTLNPRVELNQLNAPPPVNTPWGDVITSIPKGSENLQRARATAKGAAFNFNDEIEAAARMLASGDISLDEYYRTKSQINADYNAWAKAHPGQAMALETAGGVGASFIPFYGAAGRGMQALTGLSRAGNVLGRAAGAGALSGALSGVGEAERPADILPSALEQGIEGGVAGGIFGKAFQYGGSKLSPLFQRGQVKLTPEELRAGEILHATSPNMSRDIRATALANRYGVPTPLGLVNPELAALTEKVLAKPSAGQRDLATGLVEMQGQSVPRLEKQAERAFPNTQDYFDAQGDVTDRLRAIGANEYKTAYAVGDVRDPVIESVIYNPELAGVWKNAQRLARLNGTDLNMKMEVFINEADELAGLRPTGDSIPNVQALDYFKRALDDIIDAGYRGTSSVGKTEASALKAQRAQLVTRLDELVPEYKLARRKYAGDMEVRDALQYGRDLLKPTLRPQEVKKAMADMSDAERKAVATGSLQALFQPLENAETNRNFAQSIRGVTGTGAKLEKLRYVMTPAEFKFYSRALQRESDLFQRSSKVLGGSRTVPLSQGVNQLDDLINNNAAEAVNFILSSNPGRAATLARWVAKRAPGNEFGDKVYTQLSRALAANDPEKLQGVLDLLKRSKNYAEYSQGVKKQATGRVAAVAGNVAPSLVEDRGVNTPPTALSGNSAEELQATIDAGAAALNPEEAAVISTPGSAPLSQTPGGAPIDIGEEGFYDPATGIVTRQDGSEVQVDQPAAMAYGGLATMPRMYR